MADKLTGLEHARRKRRIKTNTRRIIVFFSTIAAIFAVIIGINALWQSVFVEKVSRSIASLGTGDGYPVITEGKAIQDIHIFGPDIVVVSDTSLQVYNKTAKCLQDTQHNLPNPVAEFSDVRVLLYEPNSKRVSVYNSQKKLFDKDVENPITSAAISNSGVYAVATQGTRDASVMYVYNKASDIMFTWYSEERISDITVSPDGRYVTASTLTANEGVLVTKLYTFDAYSKKQKSVCEIKDEMSLQLSYKNNSEFFCITDKNAYDISSNGEIRSSYSYGGKTLSGCDIDGGKNIVLMLGNYDDLRKTTFVSLDGKLTEMSKTEIEADVIDFKADDNLTVLTEHGVYEYGYDGVLKSSLKLNSGRKIASGNGYVYICTSNGIEKLALQKGDVISAESDKK